MANKYSAGLVSKRFWFPEFKLYIQLRLEGYTDLEIKEKSEQENIFLAPSASRQREIQQTVKRRVATLGDSGIELFEQLNVDNKKLLNLSAILMLDNLFSTFMTEVYAEKLRKGNTMVEPLDYRTFFTEKQRSTDEIKHWKEYTMKRLAAGYHTYLSEAGLLQKNSQVDEISPKVLDKRLIQWLSDRDRKDIVLAIGGKF